MDKGGTVCRVSDLGTRQTFIVCPDLEHMANRPFAVCSSWHMANMEHLPCVLPLPCIFFHTHRKCWVCHVLFVCRVFFPAHGKWTVCHVPEILHMAMDEAHGILAVSSSDAFTLLCQ